MSLARSREMPDTSASRWGSRSITTRVSSPKWLTMRAAVLGPMPFTTRLDR